MNEMIIGATYATGVLAVILVAYFISVIVMIIPDTFSELKHVKRQLKDSNERVDRFAGLLDKNNIDRRGKW